MDDIGFNNIYNYIFINNFNFQFLKVFLNDFPDTCPQHRAWIQMQIDRFSEVMETWEIEDFDSDDDDDLDDDE